MRVSLSTSIWVLPQMRDETSRSREFAKLYAGHQGRLFAFICSLVGHQDMASEILQETNVVLWEKQKEFQIGTNFTAWSFRIARYQVMAARKKVARDRLVFSQEAIDLMTGEVAQFSEQHEERLKALATCLDQLPSANADVIRRRYRENQQVSEIASAMKRSVNAVHVQLHRIRAALLECVKRQLNIASGGEA